MPWKECSVMDEKLQFRRIFFRLLAMEVGGVDCFLVPDVDLPPPLRRKKARGWGTCLGRPTLLTGFLLHPVRQIGEKWKLGTFP